MKFATKLATVSAVALLVGAAGASAASISIGTVTGIWSDVDPDNVTNITGVGTSSISWGTGTPQSGYDFSGLAPQNSVTSPFTVGSFTHNNYPIASQPAPPSITGATLDVTVTGDVDGTLFSLVSQFVFSHNETPNQCSPQPDCANDIVTLVSATFGSDTINVDGEEYIFNILGFTSGTSFSTVEGQANTTDLIGEFITRPSVVPLPAAGWLLLGGLGGLAALRRKKKAA